MMIDDVAIICQIASKWGNKMVESNCCCCGCYHGPRLFEMQTAHRHGGIDDFLGEQQ